MVSITLLLPIYIFTYLNIKYIEFRGRIEEYIEKIEEAFKSGNIEIARC